LPPVIRERQSTMIEDLRTRLGDTAFTAAWESGRSLLPEEAIEEAIAEASAA